MPEYHVRVIASRWGSLRVKRVFSEAEARSKVDLDNATGVEWDDEFDEYYEIESVEEYDDDDVT